MKTYFSIYLSISNDSTDNKRELFIVSRNIQPGDKLKECCNDNIERTVDHFESVLPTGIWVFTDGEYIKCHQAFKVVGKLSSEAKWVKEFDVFDEEEIIVRKICRDDSTPPFSSWCSHCGSKRGCDNEEGDEVLIKGPCGHFH